MKTVFFSHVITDVVCAAFMVLFWYRNRTRFQGLSLWVGDYVFQVAALSLILMRRAVPDFISLVLGSTFVVAGAWALFVGLERFIGKRGPQIHNCGFLAAFALVHVYFTLVQPNLSARSLNISLGIAFFAFQGMWLLLYRADAAMRPITRGLVMVFGAYSLLSVLRAILILAAPQPEKDFFQSGGAETLVILAYQILFIVKTYALAMMVNRRLIGAVQTQEERFRSMVEFSSDWGYWVAPDGRAHYTTPSCEGVTGYAPQEFIEDPELRTKIVHPEDQAVMREHADDLFPTAALESIDLRIVTRNGETRWVNHMCRPVHDSEGRWLGRVVSNRDITQRKQMERQLIEARKDWERIFHASRHVTFILSPQQELLAVNRMGKKLIDRQAHELIGKRCYEVFDISSAPPAGCPFLNMKDNGGETTAEMEVEALCRIFMMSCTPVLDENGKLDKVILVARDITENRKAEEKIKESEETYRNIFQNVQVGLYRTRISDGKILESNEQLARMFGYDSREEFIGEYVTSQNYVDPGTRERMLDEIKKNGVVQKFEVRFCRKDGSIFWARYSARIYPEKGWIEGVAEDITEQKRGEEEREKLQSQFIQAQKMESVGRLAGGVAHDFNNKLTVILGYAQMAMEGLDTDDPLYGNLQQVSKAGRQSTDIVRQFLAFARKQIIAPEVLDLNEALEGMLKMLRRLIGEDIDLGWEPAANLWQVNMDPAQIDQILANLCVNARDAISGVGKVTIETENVVLDESYCADRAGFVPGEYVMLAVSDDGIDMDEETLAHAFEPFFTTKEMGKGTGLGLSTVYGIVKQNQGFVNIYSEPGKGTCFKVYLPRHHGKAEKAVEAAQTEIPRGRGETILVVEDETSVLHLARRILEKMGYVVLTAATPAEAVDVVREDTGDIHLLITDVVLPGMSGKDLAGEMMQIRPNIRTLFMSGYTANVIAHQGVLEKGVQFLGKPFTPDNLARKVREALET